MTHYKWIMRNGDKLLPPHGGKGEWPPVGQWLDADGPVDPCEHGLHLCRVRDLASWVRLDLELYEVEIEGAVVEASNKIVVSRARLTRLVGVAMREILAEWSRGCVRSAIEHATRVLPVFEAGYPDDARPRKAVEAAQAWLDGAGSNDAAASAADAAANAANAAASAANAAYAAANAANAANAAANASANASAANAAYAAASAAANAAAYAAANAADAAANAANAADAERQRQGEDLLRLMNASAPRTERPIGGAK